MGLASTKVPLNTKNERKFCPDKGALWTPIWWQNVYFSTKRQLKDSLLA